MNVEPRHCLRCVERCLDVEPDGRRREGGGSVRIEHETGCFWMVLHARREHALSFNPL